MLRPPAPNRSSLARPKRRHSARPGPKRPQNRPARRPLARAAGLLAPNATALAGENGAVRLGPPRGGTWRDVRPLAYDCWLAAGAAAAAANDEGRVGCIFWLDPEVQHAFEAAGLLLTGGPDGRPQVRRDTDPADLACSLQRLIAAARALMETDTDWGWRDPGPSAKRCPPSQQWPARWDAGHICARAPGCINRHHVFPQPTAANRAAGAASRGAAAPTPTPHATPKPPPTRSSARAPPSTNRRLDTPPAAAPKASAAPRARKRARTGEPSAREARAAARATPAGFSSPFASPRARR